MCYWAIQHRCGILPEGKWLASGRRNIFAASESTSHARSLSSISGPLTDGAEGRSSPDSERDVFKFGGPPPTSDPIP